MSVYVHEFSLQRVRFIAHCTAIVYDLAHVKYGDRTTQSIASGVTYAGDAQYTSTPLNKKIYCSLAIEVSYSSIK